MNDQGFLMRTIQLAEQSDEPLKCACILVDNAGEIVAETVNSQRKDELTSAHAEMKAIALANAKLGRKLPGITAYCNCEPCTMCLSAMIFAGVKRIVFANRLNYMIPDDKKIDIDCFEFAKKFPKPPLIEQIAI